MNVEALAAVCGIVAVAGQLANIVLYLSIRAAILEERDGLKEWVDMRLREYVRREACRLVCDP